MHHSGGAAAETDLIYGSCIRAVFDAVKTPAFLVVGLGLGYIEMAIARAALERNQAVRAIRSFESLEGLREFFYAWVHAQDLPSEIADIYDAAAAFVLGNSRLSKEDLRKFLRLHFPRPDSVSESLDEKTFFTERYDGILYDAFSSKTSPELWEEDFLTRFLGKAASPQAFLSTYACKGNLKRALKAEHFEIIQKPGFQGKRNSLFARRI